jgi:hypothetical protein
MHVAPDAIGPLEERITSKCATGVRQFNFADCGRTTHREQHRKDPMR